MGEVLYCSVVPPELGKTWSLERSLFCQELLECIFCSGLSRQDGPRPPEGEEGTPWWGSRTHSDSSRLSLPGQKSLFNGLGLGTRRGCTGNTVRSVF